MTPEEICGNIYTNITTLYQEGDIIELKALNSKIRGQRNHHGYYTDYYKAACDAYKANVEQEFNIYVGLNPRSPELTITNEWVPSSGTKDKDKPTYDAHDGDIPELRLILVDIDPINKKMGGANKKQLTAALQTRKAVCDWFITNGCPPPHIGFSGNGFHLLYHINLPPERSSDIQRLLLFLNETYSNDIIKIDEKVFNPARVTRLYGTLNLNCPEPRRSKLEISSGAIISTELLDKLLEKIPKLEDQIAYRQERVSSVNDALELANMVAESEEQKDPLAITPEVESYLIRWLISSGYDPQAPGYDYFNAILPYLKQEHFNNDFYAVIFHCLINYVEQYNSPPTTDILRSIVREIIAEHQPDEEEAKVEQFDKLVADKPELSTLDWFRDNLNPALEAKAADIAYIRMQGAVQAGEYDEAERIWGERWKATDINDNYFGFMDVEDLIETPIKYEWIVEGMFALGQPTAIGGLQKCLKTGCICDLVISLATGTPFLGYFPVPRPFRVAYILAEGPLAEIRSRLATVRNTRPKVKPGFLNISSFKIKLSNDEELARLKTYCEKNKIEVLVVDPMYLTLLAGTSADPANVYAMGDILAKIGTWSEKIGITPILCHHFRLGCKPDSLELSNFTYSGLQQFARQSFLIGRESDYTTSNDNHMIFSHHGHARSGYYTLHINEGEMFTDEEGNIIKIEPWKTLVQTSAKTNRNKTDAIAFRNEEKIMRFLQLEADADRMQWFSKNSIIKATGINNAKLAPRLESLRSVGKIEVSDDSPPRYRMALDYYPPIPDDPADMGLDGEPIEDTE